MTRTFLVVIGAGLFLVANVALVIWVVVVGWVREIRGRKGLRDVW